MNGVIVDIQGEHAAVLCENGSIEKFPNKGYEIGQQIEIPDAQAVNNVRKRSGISKFVRKAGTAAAAFVLVAGLGSGIAYAMPYGTVSLDSDASVEYTINCFNRVIGVKGVNENGCTVLDAIDSSLLNKDIEDAIAVTIEQIDTEGYLDNESGLVISVGTKGTSHSEQLADELGKMVESDTPVQAEIIPVTMNDIDTAHENDMTAGQKWLQENNRTGTNSDTPKEPETVNDNNSGQSNGDMDLNNADNSGDPGRENGENNQTDGNNQILPDENFNPDNQDTAPSPDSPGELNQPDKGGEGGNQSVPPES